MSFDFQFVDINYMMDWLKLWRAGFLSFVLPPVRAMPPKKIEEKKKKAPDPNWKKRQEGKKRFAQSSEASGDKIVGGI